MFSACFSYKQRHITLVDKIIETYLLDKGKNVAKRAFEYLFFNSVFTSRKMANDYEKMIILKKTYPINEVIKTYHQVNCYKSHSLLSTAR